MADVESMGRAWNKDMAREIKEIKTQWNRLIDKLDRNVLMEYIEDWEEFVIIDDLLDEGGNQEEPETERGDASPLAVREENASLKERICERIGEAEDYRIEVLSLKARIEKAKEVWREIVEEDDMVNHLKIRQIEGLNKALEGVI